MRKAYGSAAKLFAAAAIAAALPAAALAQTKLAPGIQSAPDLVPPKSAYVVTNEAQLYKSPSYVPSGENGGGGETGAVLKRGEHPEVLGEASGGMWLLIGKGGTGIGYAPRGLMCPANVCTNVN